MVQRSQKQYKRDRDGHLGQESVDDNSKQSKTINLDRKQLKTIVNRHKTVKGSIKQSKNFNCSRKQLCQSIQNRPKRVKGGRRKSKTI